MKTIDINCDLGEGGTHDAEIMKLISSCNIASGGHFGNEFTINSAVKTALENQVNIGAHPSYPDKLNFGRESMEISAQYLEDSVFNQIKNVLKATKSQNGKLHQIKPHGALYNDLMLDYEKAEVVISVVQSIDDQLILFVPPNSALQKLAIGKLKIMVEGFADRNYKDNFQLVSRKEKGALLLKKEKVLERIVKMVKEEKVPLKEEAFLSAKFDTICLHSDSPNCVEILRYLNTELPKKKIQISGR